MNFVERIVFFWETPSSFRHDWSGYLRNQIGHMVAVGVMPALAFGLPAVALVVALYAIWEWTQFHYRGASISDCLEDWGFVVGGALIGAGHIELLPPLLAFLLAGAAWRRYGE